MIKIDLAGASAMNESYSVIENQGYVAAFVDRTVLKNVSGPRDDALKEIVLGGYFFKWRTVLYFFSKLVRDIDLILFSL